MYLLHFKKIHNLKNHKRDGLLKSKIMDCNHGSNFLYEFWNSPMTFDVFTMDLILVR
jgi:hypothetical protein